VRYAHVFDLHVLDMLDFNAFDVLDLDVIDVVDCPLLISTSINDG